MPFPWTMLHWLQLHSIIIMLVVFCLVAITTYWPGRRTSQERHGLIPLRDDS